MSRRQHGRLYSGHMILGFVEVIFVGLATMILAVSSSTATPTPPGSIRAQLLHREHPSSPLRSPDHMGQGEKLRNKEVRRSAVRSRNLLQRSVENDSTFESTLDWNSLRDGKYFMTFSLGTPAQSFVAIADTGSDLTWVNCAPFELNQSAPAFSPSLSSTYTPLSCSSSGCQNFSSQYPYELLNNVTTCDSSTSCSYNSTYAMGGFSVGNLSSESITLTSTSGENVTVPDFWFGCSHDTSHSWGLADGIVGLGQGLLSFPSQLAMGHVFEDKFSYCLVNKSLAAVQSSLILFGHDAVSAPISEALQYTPILRNEIIPVLYYVGLDGISVNGVALNFSAADVAIDSTGLGGTLFDSGTPYTRLTPLPYYQLLAAVVTTVPTGYQTINLMASTGLELCYNVTGSRDYASVFPNISFKFADAGAWDLPFENSWLVYKMTTGFVGVCLAFTEIHTGGQCIFGNTQQQNFYVLYDRVNQRIGYTATDCGAMVP